MKQNTNLKASRIFSEVAEQVIRNSIRSAICIDDRYASAYEEDIHQLIIEEPRKLYRTFREEGHCDLDIYRFQNLEVSWKPEFMISNKDLLILDWELDPGGRFDSALKILNDVIHSEKIPFVVIYTATPDLSSVSKELIKEFSPFDNEAFQSTISKLEANFLKISDSKDFENVDLFMESQEELFFQHILNWKTRTIIEEQIIHKMREIFKVKSTIQDTAIKTKIKSTIPPQSNILRDPILALSTILVGQNSGRSAYQLERVFTDQLAFKVNGTIILIYHKKGDKDGIKPEELFSVFAQAVVSNPQNYLNIFSLELKDRLRETFSSIGTQFAKIDEKAFFYHLENYRTLNDNIDYDLRYINDIILKGWIGELHQQQINEPPSILEFADHRFKSLEEPPPKVLTDHDEYLVTELVKYSAYISTTMLNNRSDSTLRFGDMFFNPSKSDEYYLCITPACDCMHPENIKNNFYFVKGSASNNLKSLNASETGFHSFVLKAGEPKSILWQCKPFTCFVTKNNINEIVINYCGTQIALEHLIVLKENFTQRIANEAFGYGLRVGIDLPH